LFQHVYNTVGKVSYMNLGLVQCPDGWSIKEFDG